LGPAGGAKELAHAPSASAVTPDRAGDTWTALVGGIDSFLAAWARPDSEPELARYLPNGTSLTRRIVLIELIKVDMENRRQRGRPVRLIDDYLVEFPELGVPCVPCDLLYEEIHVRRKAGDQVDAESYFARFPDQADELRRMLDVSFGNTSSSLCRGRPPTDIEPGEQLDDFDLLTHLGTGAFARVFLARQRSMQRLVALKVSSERAEEPQTLAQLDHAHVVRVYDQRTIPDRGLHLLYMQYVAGGNLQMVLDTVRELPEEERSGRTLLGVVDRVLSERGESPPTGSTLRERLASLTWPETVCWLGARVASALGYAHRQGILHRDVKPANVLLSPEGSPRLADFNISFSSKLEGASPAAFFGGSLAYMSPEQLEAFSPAHPREPGDLDGRADLYSLGVVLWELLAGYRPFPPETLAEDWGVTITGMAADRREGPDEVASPLPRNCPPGLEQVLKKCLAPDPNDRYQTGEELSRDLDLCLHPAAQALVHPSADGWRALVRRFPILALILVGLSPNLLAAAYNLAYNYQEIIAHFPQAESAFWTTQTIVNTASFPIGIVLFALLIRPVAAGVRSGGDPIARRRCLNLGHYGAALSLAGWLLAGIAYPIALRFLSGSLPPTVLLHFWMSLVLCGLIAAAYPFFAVTFLSVRALYPHLLRSAIEDQTHADLERLSRLTWFYLLLAASVPMVAMTALVVVGVSHSPFLVILGISGLAGFALAFVLARAIQADLAALNFLASPNLDVLSAAAGSGSFRSRG
jgi:serine/threonine protein kinase